MTSLVILEALLNDDLLTEKLNRKAFVLKKLSIYSKTRVALREKLDPITQH